MSNKYRIKHSDKIVELQLADKQEKINNNFQNNINGFYSSIVRNILLNIKDYLLNLGKPTFKNRSAKYIPSSDDYNKNNKEIINDLKNAAAQSNNLLEILKDNYNYSKLFNDYLFSSIENLKSKLKKLKLEREEQTNSFKNKVVIIEDFNRLENINTKKTTANINLNAGMATLPIKEYEEKMPSHNQGTRIDVLDSSNGFNGRLQQAVTKGSNNNMYLPSVVRKPPKDQRGFESNVMYLSQTDGNWHADPRKMIDNDDTTWFEYENCYLTPSTRKKTCHNKLDSDDPKAQCTSDGWGFEYKIDGKISNWAYKPKNNVLNLNIRIDLPEPQFGSQFEINSFKIPYDDYNVKYEEFDVLSVTVFDEEGNDNVVYNINKDKEEDDGKKRIFGFDPQLIKNIVVQLQQRKPYDCYIGHNYVWRDYKVKVESSVFGIGIDEETIEFHDRVPTAANEKGEPSVDGVGFGEMVMGGLATGGIASLGFGAAFNPWFLIGFGLVAIFGETEKTTIYDEFTPNIEAFKGDRWALGIKEFNLNRVVYEKEGKVFTKNYYIPQGIKEIEMDFAQFVPDRFYKEDLEKSQDDYIQHFFSVDGGNTWNQISNKVYSDIPNKFFINEDEDDHKDDKNAGYINTESKGKVTDIMFKSILKRPNGEDDDHFTPKLNTIMAKITTDEV